MSTNPKALWDGEDEANFTATAAWKRKRCKDFEPPSILLRDLHCCHIVMAVKILLVADLWDLQERWVSGFNSVDKS